MWGFSPAGRAGEALLTRVNDTELYYESHGSGDPLLLIGGLGLAVSEMQPLIGALAAGNRVIAWITGALEASRHGDVVKPVLVMPA